MIQVENLVKKFGDFTAVNNISFNVEAGEIFAFLGPNGAGKTTTIKMLTTLLIPPAERSELDGLDPTVHKNEARRKFGIVFQDPSLDGEQTAYENMELHAVLYKVPRKVRSERIEATAETVRTLGAPRRLRENIFRRHEAPPGNRPRISAYAQNSLSRRAHAWPRSANPQPALDPRQAPERNRTTTVFLTTHYMDEADRVAHRIAIIDHGGIVAQGTSQELKQQTNSESLEQAFLALTGSSIRDESATSADQMRQVAKMWSQRR